MVRKACHDSDPLSLPACILHSPCSSLGSSHAGLAGAKAHPVIRTVTPAPLSVHMCCPQCIHAFTPLLPSDLCSSVTLSPSLRHYSSRFPCFTSHGTFHSQTHCIVVCLTRHNSICTTGHSANHCLHLLGRARPVLRLLWSLCLSHLCWLPLSP